MNFIKLNVLSHSLGLVAIGAIATGTLAACSNTTPESASTSIAATPSSTAIPSSTPKSTSTAMSHSMGNMTMDLGAADADFDLRFIDAMTPHHQGALTMAKDAQQKSQRPEIKKLADDITKSQAQEIAELQTWRKQWYPTASNKPMAYNAQMGHMMEMSEGQMRGMMMSQDLGAKDADFDLRFINAMIPHHEGAVTMAKDALAKSTRPEIKKLAQDIIASQQAEIKQMQEWKQAWYKK
jgi:uncharacterized protein (DUF305 family)